MASEAPCNACGGDASNWNMQQDIDRWPNRVWCADCHEIALSLAALLINGALEVTGPDDLLNEIRRVLSSLRARRGRNGRGQ